METITDRASSWKMYAIVVAVPVWCLITTVAAPMPTGARMGILAFAAVMTLVVWVFSLITTRVSDNGVDVRFRFFGKHLDYASIESVSAENYRWTEFLGWGLRMNFNDASTYSVIGVPGAVRYRLRGGHEFVVSTSRPQVIAEAVRQRLGAPSE